MIKYFLMFFLGSLAMGAVAALVLPASEYIPQSSNNAKNSIYNENTTSESFEVSNPLVLQSEFQFVQPNVQNREIGNNLEITNVDTRKPDAISWEVNDDLELTRIDKVKSGVRSYALERGEFLQD